MEVWSAVPGDPLRRLGPPSTDSTDVEAVPPIALAIGNFDGVHRGHRAVIAEATARAGAAGIAAGALTFEPHPRSVFRPGDPPFRLGGPAQKLRRLQPLGLDRVYVAAFDSRLSALTPEAFCAWLAETLAVRVAVFGEDFRFGAGRAGDAAAFRALGARVGLEAATVAPVGGAAVFSSSAAREALRDGRPEAAAEILGDWHRIDGLVEQGDQRGRTLGFPTANQSLEGVLHPRFGVYATLATVLDGPYKGVWPAVSSLGLRPTFQKTVPNFETHLFDFEGDLYGTEMSVALVSFLRPEVAYEGVDPLIAQMRRDAEDARAALAAAAAAGPPWS